MNNASRQTLPVTVIMLNCNGLADTRACLRSVLSDRYLPQEILVWDNGSQGDADALETEFQHPVRIIRSPINIGVSFAYNAAAREAQCAYLLFLNNDTEVQPGWLMPLLREMESDHFIAACQPKCRSWHNPSFFDYCGGSGGFLDHHGYPFLRGRVFDVIEQDIGQYDDAADVHWASAVCMMTRKDIWERFGGADEEFFAYMDEVDFCWRMRNIGYRIRCVPSSVVLHKGGCVLAKHPFRKRYLEHRNNVLMLCKNLSYKELYCVLPQRMMLECVACAYYVAHGQFAYAAASVCALFVTVIRMPSVLRRRPTASVRAHRWSKSVVFYYFVCGKTIFADLGLRREPFSA